MPYYCTVPRCTSMAGKAKNVSFHQFPRDEELAGLWNKILKRGKPYTKYSKVCSLHFRPEDYTITSVGKNKGQWRTLRKDAIPSQNLPSESPVPSPHRSRNTGAWLPSNIPNVIDPRMQHQMAQAIYMQTMLAMQAATNNGTQHLPVQNINSPKSIPTDLAIAHASNISLSEIEQILHKNLPINSIEQENHDQELQIKENKNSTSFKCQECSKCFKDPDVFILHRRTHTKKVNLQENIPDNVSRGNEKENFNTNSDLTKQETLRANPILANLLKSSISPASETPDTVNGFSNIFDTNNILSIENQIMTALAANMENYIRNLSTMLSHQITEDSSSNDQERNDETSNSVDNDNFEETTENSTERDDVKSCQSEEDVKLNCGSDDVKLNCESEDIKLNCVSEDVKLSCEREEDIKSCQSDTKSIQECLIPGSDNVKMEPNCDNEDLNDSKDSNSLVIDENV